MAFMEYLDFLDSLNFTYQIVIDMRGRHSIIVNQPRALLLFNSRGQWIATYFE